LWVGLLLLIFIVSWDFAACFIVPLCEFVVFIVAVERGGLQSGMGTIENVITRDTWGLSSSGHTLDLLGLSKTTPMNTGQPPVTATLFNGMATRLQ
jgi:hypothetical protein